jgi:hypothetical protein
MSSLTLDADAQPAYRLADGPHHDPTHAMRSARQAARIAAVDREAVIDAMIAALRKALDDRTNAITVALHDTLTQPPEDRWDLDQSVKHQPYRLRAELGAAMLRVIGGAWLDVITSIEDIPF